MNFSVPEDVKQAFNTTFEGQNKSAVLTQLLRVAIAQAQEQRLREAAAKRIRGKGIQSPYFSPMSAPARQLTTLDAGFGVGCDLLSVDGSVDGATEIRRS
jgi:hypothetical protein